MTRCGKICSTPCCSNLADLHQETADDREVTEEDHKDDITEVEEEQYAKKYKHDPLLEF